MTNTSPFKKIFRLISVMLGMSFTVFTFQNCTSVSLDGHSAIDRASVDTGRVSAVFNKSYVNDDSNIDMILIVDNSSSMAEEAAKVRKNLSHFLSNIEKRSNLNLAVISSGNLNYGVQLSPQDLHKGYEQHPIKTNTGKFLDDLMKVIPQLVASGMIREKSQKIIIMIGDQDFTNDNNEITNNEFLSAMGTYVNLKDLTIHSFVGMGPEKSSCAVKAGVRASELASDTKGFTFNICDADWSESFKSISNNVSQLAKTEFKLPSVPAYDLVVRVDGIATDAYTQDGSSLILNPVNFKEEKDYVVQVEYIKKSRTTASVR